MRLCNVCQQRPVAESLMRLRGLVRCHHCHHIQNKATRRAKWDSGYRPICRKCNEQVAAEHKYVGGGRVICYSCEYFSTPAAKRRTHRLRLRGVDIIRDWKKTHPCVDCGESDWRCLDFDHISGKRFELSKASSRSVETIKDEIAKCEVRCANCHRKRHYVAEG